MSPHAATPRQQAWMNQLRPILPELFPHLHRNLDIRADGYPDTRTGVHLYAFTILADGSPQATIQVKVPQGRRATKVTSEYRALRLLSRTFKDLPHLNVPLALKEWQDPPALILVKVTGDSLAQRMEDCRSWGNDVGCQLNLRFIHQAGRWLASLHQMDTPEWAIPAPSIGERIERNISRLKPFDLQPYTEKKLAESLLTIKIQEHTLLPLHGDYTPRNILCQIPPNITVSGTDMMSKGHPADDIGHFLASLYMLDQWQLFGGSFVYPATTIEQARIDFLEGYKKIRTLPDKTILQAYTSLHLLQRWADLVNEQNKTNIAGLRHLIIRRTNQYFIQRILG